jgi:cytochrome c-type biogenesis protein CcmH/NrfG
LRKLYEEERFDLAIDTARSFLKDFPDDHHAQMLLGNSYFRMQQYREAQRIYENVLRIDPQNTNAYENLGVVYANQGDFLRAVEKWEKLLQIAPNRSDIRRSIERAKKFLH